MPADTKRSYYGGLMTGSGMTMFAIYVVVQAVTINLAQWPRFVIAGIGLVLWFAGLLLWPPWRTGTSRPDAAMGITSDQRAP